MVELKGSEKQIAWAEQIRIDFINQLQQFKEEMLNDKISRKTVLTHYREELKAVNPTLNNWEDAKTIVASFADKCINKLENQFSSKKLIDLQQNLKCYGTNAREIIGYGANFHEDFLKEILNNWEV